LLARREATELNVGVQREDIMASGTLRPISRLIVSAGLIVLSIGTSFLVLEVAVRVLDGIPVLSGTNFVARALDEVHSVGVQHDPQVGWVMAPNLQSDNFTTGEFGVRMPSAKIVPLQQKAILFVGDSFGAGSGVTDAEAWPAVLERTIDTQVIDAAVGGYGFDQLVLRAEALLPLLDPRMLIVQARLEYGISVARMSIAGGAPKPYFAIEKGELALHNSPVPEFASSSRDIGRTRSVLGHSYLVQFVMTRLNLLQWWVASPSMRIKWELSPEQAKEVSCLLMRRLAHIRDQRGIRVAMVVQYSAPEIMEQPLHWEADRSAVIGCAEREGLEVVDTLEPLRSVYRRGTLASFQGLWQMQDNNRVYGHMSAEGNRLIANIASKQLFKREVSDAAH
jgi:hypothetical protein